MTFQEGNDRVGFMMAVTSITATCDTSKAEVTRRMTLVEYEAFEKDRTYSSKYNLTMPAIEGVGTGDVLWVQVGWDHDAGVVEARLEARLASEGEEE